MSKKPKKTKLSKATKKRGKTIYNKGWATRRANALAKAASEGGLAKAVGGLAAAAGGINREGSKPAWQSAATVRSLAGESPGMGEIVGGADAQIVEKLAKMARKKGGKDEMQAMLMQIRATARYEGQKETDAAATKRLVEVQQILADRVVCGFLAEVDHAMDLHRGLPPGQIWNIPSFTITRIVDALNAAGYTSTGRRDAAENEKATGVARQRARIV